MSDGRALDAPAWVARIPAALAHPLTSNARLGIAGGLAVCTYAVLILSTFPGFSIQLLARNPTDLFYGVATLTRETYRSVGWVGLGLIVGYALLTGVAATHAITLSGRARRRNASTLLGVVPGVLAAGCAGCGAGVLGALGFVGALATLPFDGNLLRLAGLLLLVFFLGRTGDPRTCAIDRGETG